MKRISTAILVSMLFMSCTRDLPSEELNSFTATFKMGGRTVTMSDYSIYNARTKEYDYFGPDLSATGAAVSFFYQPTYIPGSLQEAPYNEIRLFRHTDQGRVIFHIRTDTTGNYTDYAIIEDPIDSMFAISYGGYVPFPSLANITYTITKTKHGDAVNGNFSIAGNDGYTGEPYTVTGSFKNMVKTPTIPFQQIQNEIHNQLQLRRSVENLKRL